MTENKHERLKRQTVEKVLEAFEVVNGDDESALILANHISYAIEYCFSVNVNPKYVPMDVRENLISYYKRKLKKIEATKPTVVNYESVKREADLIIMIFDANAASRKEG